MRHIFSKIPLLLFITCLLMSCEKMVIEEDGGKGTTSANHNVIIRIANTDVGWDGANSRSQVHISEVCSRLQLAVYQEGRRVKYANQIVGDADFGSFAFQLEEGIYQLLILGHSGAYTVPTTNPEKLQFTNPGATNGTGFTDTFYYYGDLIVSSDGVQVEINMERATSMFRLKTNDGKPAKVKKFQFYYTGGSGALNATTGFGCVNSKQSVFVPLNDSQTGQTLTFEMYTFLHDESGTVTFTVTAFDDNDAALYTKTFKVQMKQNCITQYTGNFFTNDDVETPEDPGSPEDPEYPVDPQPGSSSSNVVYVDPAWGEIFEYTF